ncbi:DUF4127 family protein [Peptococcus simiae]|uniref:DUF4127 family protein n=1 Tax=Peptococcus simiae TaxID=1643805 RepID=A0ABW9GWG2_9FIRM
MLKKAACLCLLLSLLATGCAWQSVPTLLIPLDSRPCNTDEVALLAQAAEKDLSYPDLGLDDLTSPADTSYLWQWLEDRASDRENIIIYTNMLLNGGLMASRDPDTYALAAFLDRLDRFIADHEEVKLTLITVIPRSLPSRQDPVLGPYSQALLSWGANCDRADRKGEPAPAPPADLPRHVASRYESLFKQTEALIEALQARQQAGQIDRYLVALDDNAPYCLPRQVLRHSHLDQHINGADETAAMLMAEGRKRVPLAIHYTDPATSDRVPQYEGQALDRTVREKCAFLNFTLDPQADCHLVIHNAANNPGALEAVIASLGDDPYVIADVAKANAGDASIWSLVAKPAANSIGYSGWNTSANAIGTALAALRIEETGGAQEDLAAYHRLRLSIDQVYLAQLAPSLKKSWRAKDLIDAYDEFTSIQARKACEEDLNQAFTAYKADLAVPTDSRLYFPWNRAFEVGYREEAQG